MKNKLVKENDLEIIGQQMIIPECIHSLFTIANSPFNKSQRFEYGGILSTAISCFAYGVIIGKRLERARRK